MRRFILMFFFAIFWAVPAMADQIDGEWCSTDGRRLFINGPKIEIPSGRQIIGNYSRHGFTYTGPAGDPEMGQNIRMIQKSDELMLLYRSTAPDNAEHWNRCQVTSRQFNMNALGVIS